MTNCITKARHLVRETDGKTESKTSMPSNSSYNDLITQINQWDHEYYVLDNPSVSDAEYDQIFRKLLELEADNPDLITAQSPLNESVQNR